MCKEGREKRKGRKSRKRTVLIAVACCVAAFFLVAMPFLANAVYGANFGHRYETPEWEKLQVADFAGIEMQECSFPSDEGQMLAGFLYSSGNGGDPKGVIVMAHGLGAGHNSYMPVASYLASHGFLVFAYDATGNDNSEGESMKGIPQGPIDLDYALRYVKQDERMAGLPMGLFGHSWGGYAVGSVLAAHPDVKAAVIVAGFDTSLEMFELEGRREAGGAISLFMPYVSLLERAEFGEAAAYNVLDGLEASDATVMVIGSESDEMVSGEIGFHKFGALYSGDPRFEFVSFADRGHNTLLNSSDAAAYRKQVEADYRSYLVSTGRKDTAENKVEFFAEYVDIGRLNALDDGIMDQIVDFYETSMG